MIHGAVPAGSMRTLDQARFLTTVRAYPDFAHFRADRWDSLWRVARAVALRTDWQLGTARPTWEVLQADTGLSRATVDRRLRDLRLAGLLGIVATGRSAGTDPADPEAGNAAAVYVLAVPHRLQLLAGGRQHSAVPSAGRNDQDAADTSARDQLCPPTTLFPPALTSADVDVDITETPSLPLSVAAKEQPTHARENKIKHERASSPSIVRGLTRAQLIAAGEFCTGTENALWTKNRRLLAAAELCRRDPVIGRISVHNVASVCREFFLVRWSPRDIQTALNTRPDGTPWPHTLTVADVADVRGWMRYRLAAWRQDPLDRTSPPGISPSSRVQAEHKHQRARARARVEADEAARAARMPVEDRSASVEAALAAGRAVLRRAALTRKHRRP